MFEIDRILIETTLDPGAGIHGAAGSPRLNVNLGWPLARAIPKAAARTHRLVVAFIESMLWVLGSSAQ
jgi:hypothetical protein